ncbi:hypothetical protein DYQ86_05060 [Acidobacteria bacterium AB60]|nr:hypothetical protein DYQ86_05060 [Acidobacteria bacterium AB60]
MAQAKQIQSVRSAVLTGTGHDVIRQLNRSPERRTVAVTFADDEQGAAAERVIHQVVEFLPQLIQERQEETLKKVVNVLLTDVTPSKAAREQARMLIEAKTAILNSGDFLPATEVARLAGFSASNLSVQPNKWKRNHEIFAIQHGREDYLPLYGLDSRDHRPRKEMAEVLKIFGDAKDGWGLAFWFAGLNSFLDDERPQDVLATNPDQVIAAARDEMAELQHG